MTRLFLAVTCLLVPLSVATGQDFRRGDADGDGTVVPIVDAHRTLHALFVGGAPAPACFDAADVNDDGVFNIADSIYLLSAGFLGTGFIAPGPDVCGPDPTPDGLDCTSYPNCIPLPTPTPDRDYTLKASDASGGPGDNVEVDITLDNAASVIGWSFGMCHPAGAVSLVEVVESDDLLTINSGGPPGFLVTELTATGWYTGVIVSLLGSTTLSAGVDQELYTATYQLLLAGASSVDFCETQGTPNVPIAIVPPCSGWIVPPTDAATLTSSGSLVPINDDCADAIAIGSGETTFILVNAVTDGPDLAGFCDPGIAGDDIVHQDVWYCYTPRMDGLATFSTEGSGLDTRLAIYDGCSCPADASLVLACDDDGLGFPPGESTTDVFVFAGQSYLVQVGTFSETTPTGGGILSIDLDPMLPPSNDDCANSVLVGSGTTNFSLENATTDGPDLAGFCDPGPSGDDIVHQDVWFRYTAICDGDLTIDTAGSGFDTRLAVYSSTGCPVDPSTVVACDDDGLGFPPGESSVTLTVTAGDSFLIQVGAFSETSGTGPGMLNIDCDGIVSGSPFRRGDINSDGTVDIADTIFLLNFQFSGGPPPTCSNAGDANDDELLNIADGIFILTWLFTAGGTPPADPGPSSCGFDATPGSLSCIAYAPCP